MKTVVGVKTDLGYTRTFFCPNEQALKEVDDLVKEKKWTLVGLRSLSDKDFFIHKMNERVEELERTIIALDLVMSDNDMHVTTQYNLKVALLDNIFTQIGIVTSMLRRNQKRNYGYDDTHLNDILKKWVEREDY